MAFEKIEDFGTNCVSSAPDILSGTAQENKQWFDKAVTNVVRVAFNNLVDGVNAMENTLDAKVDKDGDKILSDENFTSQEKIKLSTLEEGAQVNVIERVSLDGTPLEITEKGVNIPLSTDTYRGMKRVATVTSAGTSSIVLSDLKIKRGHALLSCPTAMAGNPSCLLRGENDTSSRQVTSYTKGEGTTSYYILDFEIFGNTVKTSAYAVYDTESVGTETTVTTDSKALNIGGDVTRVQFYYAGAFPAGTTLELWGE